MNYFQKNLNRENEIIGMYYFEKLVSDESYKSFQMLDNDFKYENFLVNNISIYQVAKIWSYILKSQKNLKLEYEYISSTEDNVKIRSILSFKYGRFDRNVVYNVTTVLKIKNGKIISQFDSIDEIEMLQNLSKKKIKFLEFRKLKIKKMKEKFKKEFETFLNTIG